MWATHTWLFTVTPVSIALFAPLLVSHSSKVFMGLTAVYSSPPTHCKTGRLLQDWNTIFQREREREHSSDDFWGGWRYGPTSAVAHHSPWLRLPHHLAQKNPFSLCAVLLLNVSHTVNPPKAADPQTAASTQLEEEPAMACEQLPGSAGMEISSCPFATEAIRTHSRALRWVLPRLRPPVPRHILRCQPYHLVCCTGGYNSRQRDPQRLGFPQGQAARSSCGCCLCRAAQDDLAATAIALPAPSRAAAPGPHHASLLPQAHYPAT